MADDGWAPWATRSKAPVRPAKSTGATRSAEPGPTSTDRSADAGRAPATEPIATPGAAGATSTATRTADASAGVQPNTSQAPAPTTSDEPEAGADAAPTAELLELEAGGRSGRTPLSRLAIVTAALGVIDTDGLDALNMRRLGQELGVGPMAVYRHVRDKDQLLDLVIEGVLRDVGRPELTGNWREDAARIARVTREGLMRHRRAVALVASRPWVGPAGLDGIDVTLGVFRGAGLSDRLAVFAQFALGNFVQGFCAWESANLGAVSEDPAARAEALARYQSLVASLPAERFPNLVALAPEIVAGPLDARFEFGLAALLDGIEAAGRRANPGGGPA